jgi:hypothetical protein
LLKRIGQERVEALETNNESSKISIEELQEIKKTYNKKYRELL